MALHVNDKAIDNVIVSNVIVIIIIDTRVEKNNKSWKAPGLSKALEF